MSLSLSATSEAKRVQSNTQIDLISYIQKTPVPLDPHPMFVQSMFSYVSHTGIQEPQENL